MLNVKVIGFGAGGNKGAIALLENGIIPKENIVLINSTLKDVPAAYKDMAIKIEGSSTDEGCAKEPELANSMMMENLQSGKISLDGITASGDSMVILICSLEGGTGNGASLVAARYFSEVLEAKVHLFGFGGFEDDARGLKNTVDWFKALSEDYTVEVISNKKFLKDNFNNKIKAEKAANNELVRRVKALIGKNIVESEQNIDNADLRKLTSTPGFMTIETVSLGKVKNVDDFNTALINAIDNSKSLDVEPTCKRMGVVLNIREKTKDYIDGRFEVLRQRYGEPFEFFTHIQDVHEEETVTFIIAGLKMPEEEVESVYNTFLTRMNAVDRSKDAFFNKDFDTDVAGFDVGSNKLSPTQVQAKKNAFFSSSTPSVKTKNGTAQNISIKEDL